MTDSMCPNAVPGTNKNTYSPEVSSGVLASMPTSDITITSTGTVSFTFSSTTLTLRQPELNDLNVLQVYRNQKLSRGSTLIIYRDRNWLRNQVHNWSFTGLTRQNRTDILNFLGISMGQLITVVDYYGQTFQALIMNPDNPISQELPDYRNQGDTTATKGNYGAGYTWKVDLQRKPV